MEKDSQLPGNKEQLAVYNGKKLVVWTLEDWEKGRCPSDAKYCIPRPVQNGNKGELMYYYLPSDQYELIKKRQRELYEERVTTHLERSKRYFLHKYEKSLDKEGLIRAEIERVNLFLERDKNKEIYQKIIVYNEGKYEKTKAYNEEDFWYTNVESHFYFLQWLNSFKATDLDDVNKDAGLSLRQKALLHYYQGKAIEKGAGKIYQHYCFYCSSANRKARPDPFTRKTLLNKIELFETVLQYLSGSELERAKEETHILKSYLEEIEKR